MSTCTATKLTALRSNLVCGHCGAKFTGSDSQARKVKYERLTVYCSDTCRRAAYSKRAREQAIREGKQLRKGVLFGPCKTCGKMFESKADKIFCSMACYTQSRQFKEMQLKNHVPSAAARVKIAAKLRKGADVPCLECGVEFYQKRPSKGRTAKKFCSTVCYRAYLAKRFDRWIANPEGMALPQCYDEFLDREELTCVVEGCNWRGKHLTLHVNYTHGIGSDEFKRATGFNLSTGVIAKPLAMAFHDRTLRGVARNTADVDHIARVALAQKALASKPIRYRSLESVEHTNKALALRRFVPGPQRICANCNTVFVQNTSCGRALYCSKKCRNIAYAKQRRSTGKTRVRQKDGTFRWIAEGRTETGQEE